MAISNNAFVINAAMFGGDSSAIDDYISRQSSQFDQANPHLANNEVFQYAREMDNKFRSVELRSMIEEAINSTRVEARPDVVSILANLAELRQAMPVMQEYIMANPVIRKLYHRNLCDGFSDTYVDRQPKAIGWGHRPYEVVQDGVVEFIEDGYEIVSSSEAWKDADREVITQSQRNMIKATWRVAEEEVRKGENDPTNKYGGSL